MSNAALLRRIERDQEHAAQTRPAMQSTLFGRLGTVAPESPAEARKALKSHRAKVSSHQRRKVLVNVLTLLIGVVLAFGLHTLWNGPAQATRDFQAILDILLNPSWPMFIGLLLIGFKVWVMQAAHRAGARIRARKLTARSRAKRGHGRAIR